MNKKPDKGSISRMSMSNLKRSAKIFIVNNHSPQLEAFEVRIAKLIEVGSCRKIVAVKVKPNGGTAQPFDDMRLVRQITEGIDKSRKQIEAIWRTLKRDLESDVWKQWMESIEKSKRMQKSKDSKDKSREGGKVTKDAKHKEEHQTNTDRDTTKEPVDRPVAATGALENSEGEPPEEVEEEEEEIRSPQYIPRLIGSSDMQILYDELRHHDLSVADYYMIVFSKSPTVLVKDLLQIGVAISVIVHFVPCPVSELELYYPDVYNDIQEFKKCDETKNIGIFVSTLNVEILADASPIDIYEQFTNYLFDIEMLSQHFVIYQREFLEINDTMSSKENLSHRAIRVNSSKQASDITAVCVYFDNLCRMVENHTMYDRRYSSFHPRPFIDNDYGKIIVEDANELLKAAIATEMNLVTYWRAVDMVINAVRRNQVMSKVSVDQIQLPLYNELLSWESFAQRLESVKLEYDTCSRVDITDKCKLFIVRRTLHKIMESSRKYHLPTKLCFRDFCHFIAPEYVEVLRRRNESFACFSQDGGAPDEDDITTDTFFHSQHDQNDDDNGNHENGVPMFSGLTFDDTYQELTLYDKIYRFHPAGYIRVRIGNWLYKERKLTVEVSLFKCVMFAHLWDEYPLPLVPKVRLISKNGVTCNVEFFEDEVQPSISIQWPNDCQIRYINEDGVCAVEQRYYVDTGEEYKRIYTNNGCVLVYLRNDIINVLTPNGIYYNLFPIGYTDLESPNEQHKFFRPLNSVDISTELAFVRSLTCYGIDCEYFDVTKTDGRKIRVLHGTAIEERAKYLVYQWMDYGYSECFGERDDGVKLIWSADGLRCYYPCGTMIHTVTIDDYIELGLDCRSLSTENILRKINPDIIRRLEEKRMDRQVWLSYELTYHVRHERYASVTCYEDKKMIIQSPDDVKVAVSGNPTERLIVIDMGDKVSLRFMQDVCHITSSYDNDMLIKLNLIPNDDEILSYESVNARVILMDNGQFVNDGDFVPPESYDEELYFLTKPYKFGIAFIPEREFKSFVEKSKKEDYFYETQKKVVSCKKIQPINERFSMPIPEMQRNLDKLFITKCRTCFKETTTTDFVFSARTIIKAERAPVDMCDYIKEMTYIEYNLSDNIQDALDFWYTKKATKSKYSPAWRKKIRESRMELRLSRFRAPIYHAMLQHKVFPNYFEFLKGGKKVENININKLMPTLLKKGYGG